MRIKRVKRLQVPTVIKLLILPAWLGGTALFIFVIMLVLITGEKVKLVDASMTQEKMQAPYQLFAALPKKGEVLGQRVDYKDTRVLKLQSFLRFYNSPMVGSAAEFIAAADQYNLPWTLLPAIACKESGCGRIVPRNSYNAFGWAVYTGQTSGAAFGSWGESIERVARGLRQDYFDKGVDTVAEIEARYTPPSANSHHGWMIDVQYFMGELEDWVF